MSTGTQSAVDADAVENGVTNDARFPLVDDVDGFPVHQHLHSAAGY